MLLLALRVGHAVEAVVRGDALRGSEADHHARARVALPRLRRDVALVDLQVGLDEVAVVLDVAAAVGDAIED